jgi:hypothetical protein
MVNPGAMLPVTIYIYRYNRHLAEYLSDALTEAYSVFLPQL